MNDKTKAVAKREPKEVAQGSSETGNLIAQAVKQGADVAVLTQLFALQKEVKAEQAKEAFTRAMAEFQKVCPIIKKTKEVSYGGRVAYSYAPLDAILGQVRIPLADNGFSYTFDTIVVDKLIKAICKATHVDGHSETSSFEVPNTTAAKMNAQQAQASAMTYAKRYAFCNAFGILTGDEDSDGTGTGNVPTPVSVKSQIVFLLKSLGVYNKDTVAEEVNRLVKLELVDANYEDIKDRLEILVKERNEDVSEA